MKQKLDEVRTLAIKLYKASQKAKRIQGPRIWVLEPWPNLPSESVAVWDAVALEAFKQLSK